MYERRCESVCRLDLAFPPDQHRCWLKRRKSQSCSDGPLGCLFSVIAHMGCTSLVSRARESQLRFACEARAFRNNIGASSVSVISRGKLEILPVQSRKL